MSHISPQARAEPLEGRVTVYRGGSLAKLTAPRTLVVDRQTKGKGGGVRGTVTEYSKGSQRRLMERMAGLDKRAFTIEDARFVTLTYPGEWEHYTPTEVKRHLDNFLKALRRKYPKASGFWRLEFQKRGAPHFHILLLGVQWLSYPWLSESWFRIVGSGDANHLKAGTQVRRVQNWKHASHYVGKYMAKSEDATPPSEVAAAWAWPGRFWGVINKEYLPDDAIDIVLEDRRYFRLKRVLMRWLRSRGYNWISQRHEGVRAFLDWATVLKLVEVLE